MRPYRLLRWAIQELISAPGEDWDGETTKQEPAGGEEENGSYPNDYLPARVLNWVFNLTHQWQEHFANAQILNWHPAWGQTAAGVAGLLNATTTGQLCRGKDAAWCPYVGSDLTGAFYVVSGASSADRVHTSHDGVTWGIANSGTTGTDMDAVCCADDADKVMAVGGAGVVLKGFSGVWTTNTIASCNALVKCAYSRLASNRFFALGKDGSNNSKVWYSTDAATWTGVALTGAGTQNARYWAASTSQDLLVIVDDGATEKGWKSTDNGTSWTAIASFTLTGTVRGLTYNAALDAFILLTSSTVYYSEDAVTWTSMGSAPFDTADDSLMYGNGVLVCAERAAPFQYAFSVDGATWQKSSSVPRTAAAAVGITAMAYGHDRWIALAERSSTSCDAAYGMRAE